MVVTIVFIVMAASVLRAWLGGGRSRRHRDQEEAIDVEDRAENARLRDEVKQLKDRLAVIERITIEKENSLERQIEQLRDR
jgi:uncharacterized protein YlxW (UPF0749 family)